MKFIDSIKTNLYIFSIILAAIVSIPYTWLVRSFKIRQTRKNRKMVFMNGISSCFPVNQYNQMQMKEMFIQNYCNGTKNILKNDLDFIERVFQNTQIQTCNINLPIDKVFQRLNRRSYTQYVKSTLLDLACRAAKKAMEEAMVSTDDITHIIFGTMTATIHAPTLDIHIINELNLNINIKRLNVEGMGCLTGYRLIGLCRDIALESENNKILLIVCDVRSALGNQLTPFTTNKPIDKSNVIISALFRDSGGAAIFSQQQLHHNFEVLSHRSYLIPGSLPNVLLQEYDDGSIHLYLDKALPENVFRIMPPLVNSVLEEYKIDKEECFFAVHTGGPKIINGIQQCLKLLDEQLFATWYVMKTYGNLSGSSNLVVLEHLKCAYDGALNIDGMNIVMPKCWSKYTHVVCVSFGPGLGVECVLIKLFSL